MSILSQILNACFLFPHVCFPFLLRKLIEKTKAIEKLFYENELNCKKAITRRFTKVFIFFSPAHDLKFILMF